MSEHIPSLVYRDTNFKGMPLFLALSTWCPFVMAIYRISLYLGVLILKNKFLYAGG
jgi:hypothetical protein